MHNPGHVISMQKNKTLHRYKAKIYYEPTRTILLLFFFFCSGFVVFCLIFLNFSISGRFIFIFFLFSILLVLRYRYVVLLLSKSNYNLLNCGPLDEAPGSSNAIKPAPVRPSAIPEFAGVIVPIACFCTEGIQL